MPDLINTFQVAITSFAATMAVNGLVTGLIVFKFRILKVFLEVNANSTSVEQTLGSTGGTKFRHIIFVIIESSMTLLVIQLARMVLYTVVGQSQFRRQFLLLTTSLLSEKCLMWL